MKKITILLLLLLSACAIQTDKSSRTIVESGSATLSESERLLIEGYEQLNQRNSKRAIENYFDKVIEQCAYQYNSEEKAYFAARGMVDTIYYMLLAASAEDKKDAIAVETTCADALYLKGYASLDLGQLDVAQEYIQRAIDMAPMNSMYLSELGHIHHVRRDWPAALEVFMRSERAAETYSPEALKQQELARAKRGVGFSYIELGELGKAEQKLRECLAINGKDQAALDELKYIESLRAGN